MVGWIEAAAIAAIGGLRSQGSRWKQIPYIGAVAAVALIISWKLSKNRDEDGAQSSEEERKTDDSADTLEAYDYEENLQRDSQPVVGRWSTSPSTEEILKLGGLPDYRECLQDDSQLSNAPNIPETFGMPIGIASGYTEPFRSVGQHEPGNLKEQADGNFTAVLRPMRPGGLNINVKRETPPDFIDSSFLSTTGEDDPFISKFSRLSAKISERLDAVLPDAVLPTRQAGFDITLKSETCLLQDTVVPTRAENLITNALIKGASREASMPKSKDEVEVDARKSTRATHVVEKVKAILDVPLPLEMVVLVKDARDDAFVRGSNTDTSNLETDYMRDSSVDAGDSNLLSFNNRLVNVPEVISHMPGTQTEEKFREETKSEHDLDTCASNLILSNALVPVDWHDNVPELTTYQDHTVGDNCKSCREEIKPRHNVDSGVSIRMYMRDRVPGLTTLPDAEKKLGEEMKPQRDIDTADSNGMLSSSLVPLDLQDGVTPDTNGEKKFKEERKPKRDIDTGDSNRTSLDVFVPLDSQDRILDETGPLVTYAKKNYREEAEPKQDIHTRDPNRTFSDVLTQVQWQNKGPEVIPRQDTNVEKKLSQEIKPDEQGNCVTGEDEMCQNLEFSRMTSMGCPPCSLSSSNSEETVAAAEVHTPEGESDETIIQLGEQIPDVSLSLLPPVALTTVPEDAGNVSNVSVIAEKSATPALEDSSEILQGLNNEQFVKSPRSAKTQSIQVTKSEDAASESARLEYVEQLRSYDEHHNSHPEVSPPMRFQVLEEKAVIARCIDGLIDGR